VVLLAVVAAVAVSGGAVLVSHVVGHHGTNSAAPKKSGRSPVGKNTAVRKKAAAPKSKGASRPHLTQKIQQASRPVTGTESWNRSFLAWGHSTARRPAGFYYEWLHSHGACGQYATYGCWMLDVVTRNGCPHGVIVVVQETRNGANVGTAWGFSKPLAARTPAVVEVVKDEAGISGQVSSMVCHSTGT
jgi:hypothetical protein